MSVYEIMFSFNGRVNRRIFWIWNAFYYLLITTVSTTVNKLFPEYTVTVLPVILVLLIVPDLAVSAKRWHDRNKSVQWLLLYLPLIATRLIAFTVEAGSGEGTEPSLLFTAIAVSAMACGLWIFVECGFLKGDEGDNKYGPPMK